VSAVLARSGEVGIAYETLGDGPPLLLVQGLGYGGRGWGPALDLLAEDFLVVTFDPRGFGASDVPPGPYTTAQLGADAAAVLAAAGLVRAHVVGASLGGMAAQELALARPELVDRLVLACTTPGGARAFPLPQRTLALMAEAPSLAPDCAMRRFVENALADGAPDELVGRIVAYRTANPPDLAGWQALASAGVTHDAHDRLPAIAAPTLVVHGTGDAVVDVRNADLLAAAIPDARVELLDGCGHLFFWERPERFAVLLREFLA
jgi:pimeloyl-ACP methyl ester carboxylesterase